jgi:hypothetical protein
MEDHNVGREYVVLFYIFTESFLIKLLFKLN